MTPKPTCRERDFLREILVNRLGVAERALRLFDELPDDLQCDMWMDDEGIIVYYAPEDADEWPRRMAAIGLTTQERNNDTLYCFGAPGLVRLRPGARREVDNGV